MKIVIELHERFERTGADLYYKKKITLYEALTGAVFQIEHLDGSKLDVITNHGEVITPKTVKQILRKGMPFYKNAMEAGNLYVQFDVELPQKSELKNIELLKNVNSNLNERSD